MDRLQQLLTEIDGHGYKAYKLLQGYYSYPGFLLCVDHVQGDPFAEPSRCRILVDKATAAIPQQLYANQTRRIALEDYLGRSFARAIDKYVKGKRGSGRSGEITISPYGQQVLRRNAVLVKDGDIDLRFQIALPAEARSISSDQAREMLMHELPQIVTTSLISVGDNYDMVTTHVNSVEDQRHIRAQLERHNLIAFVGDGSMLPRKSGVDDSPLPGAVPFLAPESMAIELERPHAGPIRGLGIPQGVTLIVGGGFHGKSTLLHALEYGVYDHILGDGRELVATELSACTIRAEDGRAVTGVDISPFIRNLPQGRDTSCFSTQNASGSTSQATNIMEALATDTHTLLIDEDTSASNFMVRDQRMQALVAKEKEPITPLVQLIRTLYQDNCISLVLVMGGSGDFFHTADNVLMLDNYQVKDRTEEAHALAGEPGNSGHSQSRIEQSNSRIPTKCCLSPKNRNGKVKIQAIETKSLRYGMEDIDLSRVEQIVDRGQLQTIGYLMQYYHGMPVSTHDMVEELRDIITQITTEGLDHITPYTMGTLAMPRLYELAATINRMRKLRLT